MRRRGAVLVQLLVGTMLSLIVFAGLLQGVVSLWRLQKYSVGMPSVQDDAREIALRLADSLRGATLCTSADAGCTLDAPVENPTASGVTVYRRNDNGTLSELAYAVSAGKFSVAIGEKVTTFCTDANLTLTYYSAPAYYSNSLTAFTPTAATTKSLAAVGIVASVTRNGLTGRYETFIRLRNSPKP